MARKYICVHAFKLSKLNEEENETATIYNFLHLFTLQVTKKLSFNILKTIILKIEKKTSIEAQSEGEVKVTWPIGENESKKDALSKREISATPNQLHLKELYSGCYPHTLASNLEMKAVTYAGKTFGRCQ